MTARPPSPPLLVTPIGQSLASPPGCALSVLVGDCRAILRSLPSESVQCCVTSPPYWGLRDYGHADQIGQEATPELFVQTMVEVFREVRRVLKSDGTCWLNLGDTYANTNRGHNSNGLGKLNGSNLKNKAGYAPNRSTPLPPGLKAKDLIGIPWRVAFALQADGWYLRQDIIWHKPNPMPESVRDRCTKAHEYLFLLSKSDRYFFDAEAIKEPSRGREKFGNSRAIVHADRQDCDRQDMTPTVDRNKRSVWAVATSPFKGAHFATYPPNLIKPCILAGTKAGDMVLDPFGGSGTTGQVALELGRKAILIELNPDYAKIIDQRTAITPRLALD